MLRRHMSWIIAQRDLFCVGSFKAPVKINEHGRLSVGTYEGANADDDFPVVAGRALDGVEAGDGMGSIDFFISPNSAQLIFAGLAMAFGRVGEQVMELLATLRRTRALYNRNPIARRLNGYSPFWSPTGPGLPLIDLDALAVRTYIAEPDRGRRRWRDLPEAQALVYANRRRLRGARGGRPRRRRAEYVERSFAHLYETGAMRRTHLRGHQNTLKRLLVHAGAFNLGLIMRQLVGHGTPRGLRGCLSAVIRLLATLVGLRDPHWTTFAGRETFERPVPVYSTDTIEIPLFA